MNKINNLPLQINIRQENSKDINKITIVTQKAFETLAISNKTEHFIIKKLRLAGALTISLVAELDSEIVGHIAFSPIQISDKTKDWYGLGPISVLPEYHRKGIGSLLMKNGLFKLKQIGGKGCALVGDPNFYKRFGFVNTDDMIYEGIPQEYFQVLYMSDSKPHGKVTFHESFYLN